MLTGRHSTGNKLKATLTFFTVSSFFLPSFRNFCRFFVPLRAKSNSCRAFVTEQGKKDERVQAVLCTRGKWNGSPWLFRATRESIEVELLSRFWRVNASSITVALAGLITNSPAHHSSILSPYITAQRPHFSPFISNRFLRLHFFAWGKKDKGYLGSPECTYHPLAYLSRPTRSLNTHCDRSSFPGWFGTRSWAYRQRSGSASSGRSWSRSTQGHQSSESPKDNAWTIWFVFPGRTTGEVSTVPVPLSGTSLAPPSPDASRRTHPSPACQSNPWTSGSPLGTGMTN